MIVFTSRSAPSAETSSTLVFLFLGPSFHLLHRPENIVYSSNDPDSIVIVDLGMQVHLPLLTLFAHLFTTQKSSASPTSNCLAGYFGYVVPEVIKTPTETHTYLVDRYDLFDTHTQTRHKFISLSLCTAIITYILLCSYSPFRSNNATALAQQNAQN